MYGVHGWRESGHIWCYSRASAGEDCRGGRSLTHYELVQLVRG